MRLALIVDDDPVVREILRLRIEKRGWTVALAEDARSGRDAFRCLGPQLITLDLVMPKRDGFGATDLAAIIVNESPSSVLVIVSSFASQDKVKAFFHDREVPLLSKDNLDHAAFDQLLAYVETAVEIDTSMKATLPDRDDKPRF